jgi:HK97 family phage major capsid protein
MPDAITKLTAAVETLAAEVTGIGSLKEKVETMEAKIAAYTEAVEKGFPLPNSPVTEAHAEKFYQGFELAVQGKTLIEKFERERKNVGPMGDPVAREEIAKCLLLFVKGGLLQDPFAAQEYRKLYPVSILKTPVGDGGNVFPVPDILEAAILMYARNDSVVLQDATVVDMISSKQSWPRETAGVTVGWGNTTAESEPTIDEVELDAEELSAYAAVRNHQLADARSDIVSWILGAMANACALEIDEQAFNGDGAGLPGGDPFSGLFTTGTSCESVVMGAGERFADINDDYLSQMIVKLDGVRKVGAKWYMNGALQHYMRMLKDTQGMPIFFPGNIAAGMPATIMGYPQVEAVKCPSTDGGSKPAIVFGNMKHLYVGRRLNSTALMVDPYGLFTTNRTRYKIYQRWAIEAALPKGFCILKTGA